MRYGKRYVYVRKDLIQSAQALLLWCEDKVERLKDVRAQLTIRTWRETVADPYLKITGKPGHLDHEIREGGRPQKKFFFGPSNLSLI